MLIGTKIFAQKIMSDMYIVDLHGWFIKLNPGINDTKHLISH